MYTDQELQSSFLSKEEINNVFVTAIEGGSNYWYNLTGESIREIRKFAPRETNLYLSEAFATAVERGAKVPVFDIEDETELLGTVSNESIENGIAAASKSEQGVKRIVEMQDENYDADTADVLFQYFVMGEVIYG